MLKSGMATPANPLLEPFTSLIGTWSTVARHPGFPHESLRGRASFEWSEGGAFLIIRSQIDHPAFPEGFAIIGSDDEGPRFSMLYFDERAVSRQYEVSIDRYVWKWWRHAPGFSQRMTCSIAEDGARMTAKGELSRDGVSWGPDLDLDYTRD